MTESLLDSCKRIASGLDGVELIFTSAGTYGINIDKKFSFYYKELFDVHTFLCAYIYIQAKAKETK